MKMNPCLIIDGSKFNKDISVWGLHTIERILFQTKDWPLSRIIVILPDSNPRSELYISKRYDSVSPEFIYSDIPKQLIQNEWARDKISAFILSGHVIYDQRILDFLFDQKLSSVVDDGSTSLCAAKIMPGFNVDFSMADENWAHALRNAGINNVQVNSMESYVASRRLYIVPFMNEVLTQENARRTENALFEYSYKGGMDFIYLYVYKPFVKMITKVLCKTTITPNQITIGYFGVAIAAIISFAMGYQLAGLTLSLITMLADATDGMLARLTFQTSHMGHLLDKVSHSIYHNIWYIAIAIGLAELEFDPNHKIALSLIILFFLIKLVTTIFNRRFGLSLYDRTSIDKFFRLVTGGKWNLNMLILFIGEFIGEFEAAFWSIAWWGSISLVYWTIRALIAGRQLRRLELTKT